MSLYGKKGDGFIQNPYQIRWRIKTKRDWNLIRKILIEVEDAKPGEVLSSSSFIYEDFEPIIIAEHIKLLIDANLIEGELIPILQGGGDGRMDYFIDRLTMDGHEFVANARNDTIWKKVKSQAAEKGDSVSMFVFNQLLTAAAKKYFQLE
jgi:hypothetical protein